MNIWDKEVFKETAEGLLQVLGVMLVAVIVIGSLFSLTFLPTVYFVPLLVLWLVLALFSSFYFLALTEKRDRER